MRVQLQNQFFYPAVGGIENYIYYASKALLEMGHDPNVLCANHLGSLPENEIYHNIKITRHPYYKLPLIPFAPLNQFYYVNRLEKFIKKNSNSFDVIWSRLLFEAYASAKAFKGDIPVIFILGALFEPVNNLMLNESISFKNFYIKNIIFPQQRIIEKRAIELADQIVVLSQMKKKELQDYYNVDPKKIRVILPGVDLDVFKPADKDKKLLNQLKIDFGSKIILTVGRLSKEKNVDLLIKSFSKLKNKDTFLVIVGDGPERNRLEKLTRQLGIYNKVRFMGKRNDVNRFYSIANLFVLCSTYEGFGQVFLEAMSSGVPCLGVKPDYPRVVVASDEIIVDGKTGFLFEACSENSLTAKIEKIFQEDKVEIFGLKARKLCEENYSWETCVKRLLTLSKDF